MTLKFPRPMVIRLARPEVIKIIRPKVSYKVDATQTTADEHTLTPRPINQESLKQTVFNQGAPKVTTSEERKPNATIIDEATPTIIEKATPKAPIIDEATLKAAIIDEATPKAIIIDEATPKAAIIDGATPKPTVIVAQRKSMADKANVKVSVKVMVDEMTGETSNPKNKKKSKADSQKEAKELRKARREAARKAIEEHLEKWDPYLEEIDEPIENILKQKAKEYTKKNGKKGVEKYVQKCKEQYVQEYNLKMQKISADFLRERKCEFPAIFHDQDGPDDNDDDELIFAMESGTHLLPELTPCEQARKVQIMNEIKEPLQELHNLGIAYAEMGMARNTVPMNLLNIRRAEIINRAIHRFEHPEVDDSTEIKTGGRKYSILSDIREAYHRIDSSEARITAVPRTPERDVALENIMADRAGFFDTVTTRYRTPRKIEVEPPTEDEVKRRIEIKMGKRKVQDLPLAMFDQIIGHCRQ